MHADVSRTTCTRHAKNAGRINRRPEITMCFAGDSALSSNETKRNGILSRTLNTGMLNTLKIACQCSLSGSTVNPHLYNLGRFLKIAVDCRGTDLGRFQRDILAERFSLNLAK